MAVVGDQLNMIQRTELEKQLLGLLNVVRTARVTPPLQIKTGSI